MANFYVSSVGYNAVAQWAASTGYTIGQYVRQLATPSVGNERVFKCTTAGTSGSTEPSWNLNAAGTTTDGGVTWTECTGMESEQVAGNWKAPAARVGAFPSVRNANGLGNFQFVSQDHAETSSAASITIVGSASPYSGAGPLAIICVNRNTGSIPPVSADLTTGASINTTGSNSISLRNYLYCRGITFSAGSAANFASITMGSVLGDHVRLKNCALVLNNSSASSTINLQANATDTVETYWDNVSLTFGNTNQQITCNTGGLLWSNTSNAIQGTMPSLLFQNGSSDSAGPITLRGVDLSNFPNTLYTGAGGRTALSLINCKINASMTPMSAAGQVFGDLTPLILDNCDDGTDNRNNRFQRWYYQGTVQSETTVIRTGGASDGITPLSWKATINATQYSIFFPMRTPAIVKYLKSYGSPVTATVEIASFNAAALTNAQAWLEIEALTDSGSPKSGFIDNRVADVLPTTVAVAQPSSTAAWDSKATLRANNTSYAFGAIIAVPDNPGRLFQCTQAGTSAASEPAAYASATDGQTNIIDGTAQFIAIMRQKLQVTFTPARPGIVSAIVRYQNASQLTLYVDPKLSVA